MVSATGGFSGVIDIDHTGAGTWQVRGGIGGASNGTRADNNDLTVRPFGGGSAGNGGIATGLDFNGATVSSSIDILLDGGQFSVFGGAGGDTSSDRGFATPGDPTNTLDNALAGNGGIAVGIDLINTVGTNLVSNQNRLMAVGGAGGSASGDIFMDGKSGDGAIGTAIDLTGSTAKTTIVNGSASNHEDAQIRGIGGRAGGTFANAPFSVSGNGADGIGINLSLAVGANVTSLINYGLIEGLGGTGGIGDIDALYGLGADGIAIKADTASPLSITNHFQLLANGGSFNEINTSATGGDAIGIDAANATAAGVITYVQSSTGSIRVVGGWANAAFTAGNATGIITGAANDVLTLEGTFTVLGGVDEAAVVKGTATGISTQDGNDIVTLKDIALTVTGVGASVAIDLGDGEDTLSLDNATIVGGSITGGAGLEDTLDVTGTNGTLVDPVMFTTTVTDFEKFKKSGTGAISLSNDISFTASGITKFAVNVTGGTLLIADTKIIHR